MPMTTFGEKWFPPSFLAAAGYVAVGTLAQTSSFRPLAMVGAAAQVAGFLTTLKAIWVRVQGSDHGKGI